MISRLVDRVEQARHGPVGAAVAAGSVAFGAAWTILQVIGVAGSPIVLLALLSLAVLLGALVHARLLGRRVQRAEAFRERSAVPELREHLERVLEDLEIPSSGVAAVLRVVEGYEEKIRHLQQHLRGAEAAPEPKHVEGGRLRLGEHIVALDTFYMDRFLVTNRQFAEFVAGQPEWGPDAVYDRYGIPYFLCEFRGTGAPEDKWDHPVVWVSWYAAAAFCNWRSLKDGKEPVYAFRTDTAVDSDFTRTGWRLPTEIEWEMAARGRADSSHPWANGLSPIVANYGYHYRGTTAVGRFPANALGLFDMLGNVKQWCNDWYAPDYPPASGSVNPVGPSVGESKVFRGASWMDRANLVILDRRGRLPPQNTNPDLGFRCVRRPARF